MLSLTPTNPNPLSVDDRMNDTILSVGIQLGEIRGTLMCEFKGLLSENRILADKINQLEMIHVVELNAAVDGYVAARSLIVEKLKGVIEKFQAFPEIYKRCGYVPLDPTPFQNIINELDTQVLESHYTELKKYPEYCDTRLSKGIPPEQVAIAPFSIKQYPLQVQTQSRIIKTAEEIESLEAKIGSMRVDNLALTEKIDIIIGFHRQHLKDLNRQEKMGRIKEIVEKVRVIYNKIIWKVSIINCDHCIKEVGHMSPNVAAKVLPKVHEYSQRLVNEKMNDVREHVLMAVISLEELIL